MAAQAGAQAQQAKGCNCQRAAQRKVLNCFHGVSPQVVVWISGLASRGAAQFVTQLEFLDLPGRRRRHGLAHLQAFGDVLDRDLLLFEVGHHGGHVKALARLGHHHRAGPLAQTLEGHDFILVLGTGDAYNKAHLLKNARDKKYLYELQDEEAGTQAVRIYGDTAIVTAKLLLKATTGGKTVETKLWFSDTYVRTPTGWRYAFGQASLPLPEGK